MSDLISGSPLYVPSADYGLALSLGASLVPGDSRLRIPAPLPPGVTLDDFRRWQTEESRVTWLSELLRLVAGDDASLLDRVAKSSDAGEAKTVRLFVPFSDSDRARIIPGVRWSREDGIYLADRSADFHLIFDYLTERSRAEWSLERLARHEVDMLVKARALLTQETAEDDLVQERELDEHDFRGRVEKNPPDEE